MVNATLEEHEQAAESFLLTIDEHQELHVSQVLPVGPVEGRRLKVRGRFFPEATSSLEGSPLTMLISSVSDHHGYELKGTCESVEPVDVVEDGITDETMIECELTMEIEVLHEIK